MPISRVSHVSELTAIKLIEILNHYFATTDNDIEQATALAFLLKETGSDIDHRYNDGFKCFDTLTALLALENNKKSYENKIYLARRNSLVLLHTNMKNSDRHNQKVYRKIKRALHGFKQRHLHGLKEASTKNHNKLFLLIQTSWHWMLLAIIYPSNQATTPAIHFFDPLNQALPLSLENILQTPECFSGVCIQRHTVPTLDPNGSDAPPHAKTEEDPSVDHINVLCHCDLWMIVAVKALVSKIEIPIKLEVSVEMNKNKDLLAKIRRDSKQSIIDLIQIYPSFFIAPYRDAEQFNHFVSKAQKTCCVWYPDFVKGVEYCKSFFQAQGSETSPHRLYRTALLGGENGLGGLVNNDLTLLQHFLEYLDERDYLYPFEAAIENLRLAAETWLKMQITRSEVQALYQNWVEHVPPDKQSSLHRAFQNLFECFYPLKHYQYSKQMLLLKLYLKFFSKHAQKSNDVIHATQRSRLQRSNTVSRDMNRLPTQSNEGKEKKRAFNRINRDQRKRRRRDIDNGDQEMSPKTVASYLRLQPLHSDLARMTLAEMVYQSMQRTSESNSPQSLSDLLKQKTVMHCMSQLPEDDFLRSTLVTLERQEGEYVKYFSLSPRFSTELLTFELESTVEDEQSTPSMAEEEEEEEKVTPTL